MTSRLRGKQVVITGGAGFIGSYLVEQIVEEEDAAEVVVIDDLSSGSRDNLTAVADGIRLVEGDVCDAEVAAVAAEADVVFHLAVRNIRASIGRPLDNFRVNADGTLMMLEAMRGGARGRFVYVSSSEIYGIPPAGIFTEEALPGPTTVYGAGKLAGELITQAYHRTYLMETMVVRPFNNYGPRSHFEGDSGEVIPKFILRALAGRPLIVHGDGTQTRDFMYVADTASWLIELAGVDALIGDVVNIGSGADVAIAELAEVVLRETGSKSEIVFGEPRPGDVPRLCADVTKVRGLVPFNLATDFGAGISKTIESFAGQDVEALLEREVERTWT